MSSRDRKLIPLEDRGPLRVMFLITSMPVGGAETLLVNLIRRLDRERFPAVALLPEGVRPAGRRAGGRDSDVSRLDRAQVRRRAWWRGWPSCFATAADRRGGHRRRRRQDVLGTPGRAACRRAGRAVRAALDRLARRDRPAQSLSAADALDRRASSAWPTAHGRHLIEQERFPADKVRVIPNGVDTGRFQPSRGQRGGAADVGPAAQRSGGRHRGGAAAGKEPRAVFASGRPACATQFPRRSS